MQFTVPMAPGAWGRGLVDRGLVDRVEQDQGRGWVEQVEEVEWDRGRGQVEQVEEVEWGRGRVADPLPLDPRGRVPQEEQDLWQKR